MYIPDEMKLNRFKDVNLPSPRDYFARLGFKSMSPECYTADVTAPAAKNKIDNLALMEEYDRMKQAEEVNE